jgi:hypothetical protein
MVDSMHSSSTKPFAAPMPLDGIYPTILSLELSGNLKVHEVHDRAERLEEAQEVLSYLEDERSPLGLSSSHYLNERNTQRPFTQRCLSDQAPSDLTSLGPGGVVKDFPCGHG